MDNPLRDSTRVYHNVSFNAFFICRIVEQSLGGEEMTPADMLAIIGYVLIGVAILLIGLWYLMYYQIIVDSGRR